MRRLLALAVVVGCSPAPRPQDQLPDASRAIDAAPAVCFEPAITGKVMQGASNIDSCAIWNSLAQMTGDVTLSRTPTMLSMAFATGVTFTGTVTGSSVSLVNTHLHDFTDGCLWRATETLAGSLDPTSCVMMVNYTYKETVETSNGACATPCAATGSLSLQITPIIQ